MTRGRHVFLVADIIGSSILMQEDPHRGIRQQELFHSIVEQIIKDKDGEIFDSCGDSVSACFLSCDEAVDAGRVIQQHLSKPSHLMDGFKVSSRIGIHTGDRLCKLDRHSEFLVSITHAIEARARADALCLSGNVVAHLTTPVAEQAIYVGDQETGIQDYSLPLYLLFSKPANFFQQAHQFLYKIRRRVAVKIPEHKLIAVMGVLFLAGLTMLYLPQSNRLHSVNTRVSELSAVQLYSSPDNPDFAASFNAFIQGRLSGNNEYKLDKDNMQTQLPALRVATAFQQVADQVRFSWSVYRVSDDAQLSGGYLTGNKSEIAAMREQLAQKLLQQIALLDVADANQSSTTGYSAIAVDN